MRRYLVVANQTLAGEHLLEHMRARHAESPCQFHLVVPATPTHEHVTWTEGEATTVANDRLRATLEQIRAEGLEATGEVGDRSAFQAVADVLLGAEFDEIIVSTLPAGLSRWVRQDLPRRIARATTLPVTHLEAQEPAEHAH